jgi:cytochrome P450
MSSLPPGPRSPAAWQLLRYSFNPLSFLEACHRRYGNRFTVRMAGYGRFIVLADPAAVRDVFRGDGHALHSGEGNEFLIPTLGSNSVLVLDGDPHARQRRALLPPLKGERMRSYFTAMQQATREEIGSWRLGESVRILEPMRRITLRVMLQVVLGLKDGPERDEMERRVEAMLAQGRSRHSFVLFKVLPVEFLMRSSWFPFARQMRMLNERLFVAIQTARGQSPADRAPSVLADLIAASHEDGTPLTDQEIRDALLTLIVAGHDTTSIALAWAVAEIVPRPDVLARLADELKSVCRGLPAAEHLSHLEYLDAVIRETLRLRTILPIVIRLTQEPFTAGSETYPAGVILSPSSHLLHRRPDVYPEPEKFRPDRFLERSFGGHEWLPFGGGYRTCMGMAFALYEMKVVLGTLLASVQMERTSRRSRPVRRGISLAPHDGVPVTVLTTANGI